MDLETLALAVDEAVRVPAADRRTGRLYAVRCDGGGGDGGAPAAGACAGGEGDADGPAAGACAGGEGDADGPAAAACAGSGGDGDGPAAAACAGGEPGGVRLELLAEGEARTLPQDVRPPAGARAIALVSGVWAAPMEDDGSLRPPSRHPERRRAHLTVIVGGEDGDDAVDVSVLRYPDGAPTVLRGGVGLLHQRLLRCWSRRPDGPWPPTLPPAA